MFRSTLAAATAAAAFLMAFGAFAAEEVPVGLEIARVGTLDEFGAKTSPGSAEVGAFTYIERDEVDHYDRVDVWGAAVLNVMTDFDDPSPPVVPPPLYLTFDIQHQGGLHDDADFRRVAYEGNRDSPFTGQIRIRYGEYGGQFGYINGPATTLATFDISPDWADVGESFSFNVYDLISGFPAGGAEFSFLFEKVGPLPHNTAWTFNNFRITTTDQTTAVPSTAVPEPGAWALMILGFGAVGSAMRSRRMRMSHAPV